MPSNREEKDRSVFASSENLSFLASSTAGCGAGAHKPGGGRGGASSSSGAAAAAAVQAPETPQRILLYSHSLPPWVDGVSTRFQAHVRMLKEEGHAVSVVTIEDNLDPSVAACCEQVTVVASTYLHWYPAKRFPDLTLGNLRKIWAACVSSRAQVLHATMCPSLPLFFMCARALNIPLVVSVHTDSVTLLTKCRQPWWVVRLCSMLEPMGTWFADATYTVSPSYAAVLLQRGIKCLDVTWGGYANASVFHPARKQPPASGPQPQPPAAAAPAPAPAPAALPPASASPSSAGASSSSISPSSSSSSSLLFEEAAAVPAAVVPAAAAAAAAVVPAAAAAVARDWRRELSFGHPEDFILITAGRVSPEKDIAFLVALVRRFRAQGHRVWLGIIGDGPAAEDFAGLHGDAAAGVWFEPGFLKQEELAVVYASVDLVASASTFETFGFTALEAMACGTPFLGPRAQGFRDVVAHNKGGYLFDARDLDSAAHYLELLVHEKEELFPVDGVLASVADFTARNCLLRTLEAYRLTVASRARTVAFFGCGRAQTNPVWRATVRCLRSLPALLMVAFVVVNWVLLNLPFAAERLKRAFGRVRRAAGTAVSVQCGGGGGGGGGAGGGRGRAAAPASSSLPH